MKKTICILLTGILLLTCFSSFAYANTENVRINGKFYSDIAGKSYDDLEAFADFSDSDMVLAEDEYGSKSFVCAYNQQMYFGTLTAGRTYYIHYTLKAAPGYCFSDTLDTNEIHFTCEQGSEIVNCYYMNSLEEPGTRYLYVCEKITVQGNFFERLIGFLSDWFLMLKSWSLY